MTQPEFLAAVAAELRLLGQPYDRGVLESFIASCWPLVEEDPLEIGLHVLVAVPPAQGGRGKKGGLSAYAEKVGRSQQYISQLRDAAEVAEYLKTHSLSGRFLVTRHPEFHISELRDHAKHLAAIAPGGPLPVAGGVDDPNVG